MKTWMLLVMAGVVSVTVAGCSWCRAVEVDCCDGKKANCPSMQQEKSCPMMDNKDGKGCPMAAESAK